MYKSHGSFTLTLTAAACCRVSKYSTSSDLKCSSCSCVRYQILLPRSICVGPLLVIFLSWSRNRGCYCAMLQATLNSPIVTGVIGIGFEGRTTDIVVLLTDPSTNTKTPAYVC
eukprot:scaffold690_cov76-Skeletonema_dohrnii-CCMP3373.AAC.7